MWGPARNSPTRYNNVPGSDFQSKKVSCESLENRQNKDDLKYLVQEEDELRSDGAAKFDFQCRGHGRTAAEAAVAYDIEKMVLP